MAVCSGDPDAAVAIGKDAGFMISTDDLTKAQSEVSDGELEGAAGGAQPKFSAGCPRPEREDPKTTFKRSCRTPLY